MTTALLAQIALELEDDVGSSLDANLGKSGWWARIALAAEQAASVTSPGTESMSGYMSRTAEAFESLAGITTTANKSEAGYLTRIVAALENINGQTYTGSLLMQFYDAAVDFTVGADTTAPVLSSPTGTATSPTTASLGVTTDETGGTLWVSVLPSASAAPLPADFIAGTTGGDFVTFTNSPVAGVIPFSATGLDPATAYKAHYFQRDANNNESNVASSAEFTTAAAPDITAPVLSAPAATVLSYASAHINADTDEANGDFFGYVSESATPPNATDLQAGTGAAWFGNLPVSAVGTQELHAEGLDPETDYWGHMLHVDDATNISNIVSTAMFTTDALPAFDAPVLTQTSADGANPLAFTTTFDDLIIGQDEYHFRHRVNAGAWVDETAQSVTSAWYTDHIMDGVPLSRPNYEAASFNSGETVGVQAGIARGGAAVVWSTELTDVMAVDNVTLVGVGKDATATSSSTSINYSNKAFTGGGRALIFLTGFSNAGGSVDSLPASITITPSGGGAAITCTSIGEGGRGISRAFAIYLSDSDVSTENYNITGTRPAAARSNNIIWGTLVGANPTPTTAATFTSGSSTNPKVTASLTCVANGLLIGAIMAEADTTFAATNSDTTLVDYCDAANECSLVLGTRVTTGAVSFDSTPNNNSNWGKGIVAFGPA